MSFDDKALQRLEFLYGSEQKRDLLNRLKKLVGKHNLRLRDTPSSRISFSQEDAVLITYGDVILPENGQKNKLQTLKEFVEKRLGDAVNTVHILPFFPSSSDQGFSVIDYLKVREDLGDWEDIESLSEKYNVMADLVINHTSRFSDWFENYQMGKAPGKDYFIEVDPSTDLSNVTRPRSSPLLTTVKTNRGMQYVWTTFSDDQIDLNFINPDVLIEFVDIFLFYLSKGINLIRLDAIAYLWKEIGTNSIHLEETHQVIKLFRDIVDHIDPDITLITETNVPFDENINYFGDGDEAHMIYQFSLPPLLLHAILTENGQYLTQWAQELPEPREGCTYFNFTASHDGIGVRPLEGLVPDEEFDYLIKSTKERGGFVSYKKNEDNSQSPYELNITYYDAFAEPGRKDTQFQVKRYLCSQIIMLSLQGVPGVYFHNFTATKNYLDGVTETGEKRAINRKQWGEEELEEHLSQTNDITHYILTRYKELLQIRKQHSAFSPAAKQEVLDLGNDFFVLHRSSDEENILCISNITHEHKSLARELLSSFIAEADTYTNILTGDQLTIKNELKLEPFKTVWLAI
ncbi:sugar phosphorylase [Fodinibius salsisoli]|uniref:Cyclomaltodextrinase C-terminal domain-containing protein n=1 Tax=Fodinibius salsisoli TaxID=2820877 RepID=A0ABT3PTE0_9BACT|nr:sugar phosphorylase [Fodinibius salsisoli]MCW9709097.1 cyclomaltodextrinase C-terminal domain-containing protein [Fodinibius salsisoli]